MNIFANTVVSIFTAAVTGILPVLNVTSRSIPHTATSAPSPPPINASNSFAFAGSGSVPAPT